jgi:hypothetical protein
MSHSQTTTQVTGVYRSYLVRFWQSNEQGAWRASVQCVQTGSTVLFGDVEGLFAFLRTAVAGQISVSEVNGSQER